MRFCTFNKSKIKLDTYVWKKDLKTDFVKDYRDLCKLSNQVDEPVEDEPQQDV